MEERRGREEVEVRGNLCSSKQEADLPIRPKGTGDCVLIRGRGILGAEWIAAALETFSVLPSPLDPAVTRAPSRGREERPVWPSEDTSAGLFDLTDVCSLCWRREHTIKSLSWCCGLPWRILGKKDACNNDI